MEKIKKIDPDFNLTEEDIIEAKKEDPSFELTEDDLRLGLWVREFSPSWENITNAVEKALDVEVLDFDSKQGNIVYSK